MPRRLRSGWEVPRTQGRHEASTTLIGIAIVAFMAYDYPRFFANVAFEPRSMVGEGDVVLAEHRMSATLPNGRDYVNDYCFAYEVADGRVTAIREYMDTRGGWLQVFGGDPPEVLVEGTPPHS